jgi:putative (di)nucleoside polyphosphate hydrolase
VSEDRGYRPCVGIMLFDDTGRIFVGRRVGKAQDNWQMPQGGIDAGEEPREAAMRELAEEVGTDKAEIVAESKDWLRYDVPETIAGRLWRGRFRGQRQKWFLMRFRGTDADIDLDAHHPEFDDWRWIPPEEAPTLIVEFKRDVYRRVVAEFAPQIARRIAM